MCFCFFFFSSRRRHTRSLRDWSSDVCSSDLAGANAKPPSLRVGTSRGTSKRAIAKKRRPFARWIEIGRASCRERGEIAVGDGAVNKKREIQRYMRRIATHNCRHTEWLTQKT